MTEKLHDNSLSEHELKLLRELRDSDRTLRDMEDPAPLNRMEDLHLVQFNPESGKFYITITGVVFLDMLEAK